ncbi:MAG: hypothetical protein JNK16_01560 [Phycisphaerales bacterium]|nr:hypothetical protein [Phycisphaerales bacterium]
MVSKADLVALQALRGYPSVSILAPTNRSGPAKKQDRVKVGNLLRKAIERLEKEFGKREAAAIVAKLKKLVASVDWQQTQEGLAIFASASHGSVVKLPFRVKPRVQVDETFATRDLVYSLNRSRPYRVLTLGHVTRLFEVHAAAAEEIRGKPFPFRHGGPGGGKKLPGGIGINSSATRDTANRTFYKAVDEAVRKIQDGHPLPLVLVGAERNLAFYHGVTTQEGSIVGMLTGNHETTSPRDLGALVWPIFEAGATSERTAALVRLDRAVSANRAASGIVRVWNAASARKCEVLLVEKDFKYPADVSADGSKLLPYTGKGPQALDDAVDEIIESVMAAGGRVYFYNPGELGVHQRIGAVLRK